MRTDPIGFPLLALGAAVLAFSCATPGQGPSRPAPPTPRSSEMRPVSDLARRVAQYAPTPFSADLSTLSAADRRVLGKLADAGRLMDEIFLRQAWAGNPELRDRVERWEGHDAQAVRDYFDINVGPWDRLDETKPWLGELPHPPGAGFYPEDLTKEEFEAWLAAHPGDRERLTSSLTVVRREGKGLVAVPYSAAYREWLVPAAGLLREAAAETGNASLAHFLKLRADAFLSDDYYDSDFAWMDVDAPVEVTIGPYETYEDSLYGYKAAFEVYVTVALPAESKALDRFKGELPWLERNLPIPDSFKNLSRGTDSPIRVVDLVYGGGDAKAGAQALAYNLPNDERVREAKGSKKVLLRNTMRAKFDQILVPIGQRVLAPDQVADVAWEAYFQEVLHHELSHGLGPGTITVDGRKTEVRLELKELFSAIEEAKADVMGVYNILALMERGEMPKELARSLEPTYVAGLFRSARFGLEEAHGQGVVAQFGYLRQKGALVVDDQGRFRSVSEKFPGAIRDLLAEMLTLQAHGDYAGTKAFLDRYGKPDASLRGAIARLTDVPVDIRPIYQPVNP
jgi:hypothetical protein